MNTNELKQAFIKRMIQKIETEINLTLNSLESESDRFTRCIRVKFWVHKGMSCLKNISIIDKILGA